MWDEDAAFALAWAPKTYAKYDPSENGVWRSVLHQGKPVGVIWSNLDDGAGILWIKQTDPVFAAYRHFARSAEASTPAHQAYLIATELLDLPLGPEESGALVGVDQFMEELMDGTL